MFSYNEYIWRTNLNISIRWNFTIFIYFLMHYSVYTCFIYINYLFVMTHSLICVYVIFVYIYTSYVVYVLQALRSINGTYLHICPHDAFFFGKGDQFINCRHHKPWFFGSMESYLVWVTLTAGVTKICYLFIYFAFVRCYYGVHFFLFLIFIFNDTVP